MNFISDFSRWCALLCFFLYGTALTAQSQAPDMVWGRTYGESGQENMAKSVIPLKDGFVIAGLTRAHGAGMEDMWMIRTDEEGELLWEKTYGGASTDIANDVIQTKDGGFMLVGFTRSKGAGRSDMWVIKTLSDGTPEWERTYGSILADEAYKVLETDDGGYLVAGLHIEPVSEVEEENKGTHQQRIWVMKLNKSGEMLWGEIFWNKDHNVVYDMIETKNGGFAIAGSTLLDNNMVDAWLININDQGQKVWEEHFGGVRWDAAHAITQTSDGGFVLGGTTFSNGLRGDVWVIRTNAEGKLQWQKYLGGKEHESVEAIYANEEDNSVTALVNIASLRSGSDIWMLLGIDAKGEFTWSKILGDAFLHKANGFTLAKDGSIAVIGNTFDPRPCEGERQTKAYMVKLSN